ncbi:hypothetical protein BGZ83_009695 [Gryganskiella cystojenkinii]|nr:hypothetical protein BGZ83_009695 [Gryganskiella cystojenkinii]
MTGRSPPFFSTHTHNHPSPIDLDPFDDEDPFSISASSASSTKPPPTVAVPTSLSSSSLAHNSTFSIPVATNSPFVTHTSVVDPWTTSSTTSSFALISPTLSEHTNTSSAAPTQVTESETSVLANISSPAVTASSFVARSISGATSVPEVPSLSHGSSIPEPEGLPPAYDQLESLPGSPPMNNNSDNTTYGTSIPPTSTARTEYQNAPPVPPMQPTPQLQQQPQQEPQHQQQQQIVTTTTTTPVAEPESVNEYVLKPVDWIDPKTGIEKRIKIITQNQNGPCPLLALCNTLILQGKVAIRPYDRPTIGYDHLLQLLADYLLSEEDDDEQQTSNGDPAAATSTAFGQKRVGEKVAAEKIKSRLEIESALRLLPHLEHGLDVNVFFKSIRGFESTAELGLFHTFGVELVHGWVVSPVLDTAMYALVDAQGPEAITSYNKAVECIVSGDDAGGGLVVEDLAGNFTPITPTTTTAVSSSTLFSTTAAASAPSGTGVTTSGSDPSSSGSLSHEERIRRALIVQEFITTTRTQLTHYGLHVLQESLPEGHLCAFFRNNHFCTLFKNPMDGILYTLVTDQSLAHEQSIVWESLADVDGAGDFLDGLFRHGALEVGDYARNNQPLGSNQHSGGRSSGEGDGGGDEDFALALQLQQQEEEEEARRVQKANNRLSLKNSNNPNNHLGVNHSYEAGSSSSSGNSSIMHPTQVYETDEQMAARLHQEFLVSSQQELRRNQSQAYPPQHSQQSYNQYSSYTQPAPQIYEAYPPPAASTSTTLQLQHHQQQQQQNQRPFVPSAQTYQPPVTQQQRPSQQQQQQQQQPQQQYQYPTPQLTTSASQRRPAPGPNSTGAHGRHRNSSEGSDKSNKDKCMIM